MIKIVLVSIISPEINDGSQSYAPERILKFNGKILVERYVRYLTPFILIAIIE